MIVVGTRSASLCSPSNDVDSLERSWKWAIAYWMTIISCYLRSPVLDHSGPKPSHKLRIASMGCGACGSTWHEGWRTCGESVEPFCRHTFSSPKQEVEQFTSSRSLEPLSLSGHLVHPSSSPPISARLGKVTIGLCQALGLGPNHHQLHIGHLNG